MSMEKDRGVGIPAEGRGSGTMEERGGFIPSMDVSLLPFFPPWRRTEELGTTEEGMSGVP